MLQFDESSGKRCNKLCHEFGQPKRYSPGWKMMDSQEFWYIRITGSNTELGSPFPGWKIISTHYQGFPNNVQINVPATSKHVVKLLGANFVDFACFFTSPSFHSHHPFKTLPKPSHAPDLVKLWWIGNACAACGTSGEEKKNRQSVLDGSETETPFWDTLPKTNGWIPKMMVWKR